MQLETFDQLPMFDTEFINDWILMMDSNVDGQKLILLYSVKRDFLSVPKTYQVVTFQGSDLCPLEYHHLERDDYLSELDEVSLDSEPGWYLLDDNEEGKILLMLTPYNAIEIACAGFQLEMRAYHSANEREALIEYLNAKPDSI
ncbi:hypothetical protein [Aliikangiella maris]|uniref:Uncharacterized protein n=2 Tax=Aliikangiella maris TaxID=3162458 RepID=A0ABV2BTQ8_9GAMM